MAWPAAINSRSHLILNRTAPATISRRARQLHMTNAVGSELPLLSMAIRQNRSLSKRGRGLWLMLIAASVLVVALGAAAVGAWLILPFAGFEVFLVWLAFYVVGQHDADYELLVVTQREFRWERRDGLKTEKLEGSRDWARLSRTSKKFDSDTIQLLYGGNRVTIGRLLCSTERKRLGAQMASVFRSAVN
jgi:uncharacterized membrane protein